MMLRDDLWNKVLPVKPLLSRLLPGDYLMNSFHDCRLAQFVAAGMKYYAMQYFLLHTMDECGGACVDSNMGRLVSWLLNALVNGPGVQEASDVQGPMFSALGPIEFLKQCEVITTREQYSGDADKYMIVHFHFNT